MNEQDVLVIIPARMASKRFPGKPLADAGGKPLLWHAWNAASTWLRPKPVIVTPLDDAILDVVVASGADALKPNRLPQGDDWLRQREASLA